MAVNVFFLRVSSSQQHLESQFDEVWNHYSKPDKLTRDSIKVIEYKESGVKLSEEERLGIIELKHLVDTVGVNCIYVSELSRIARTETVLWSFVGYLQQNKIQLKCKNPEFCLLNEDRTAIPFNSRLMVSTFGTLATQEAIEKKARFARGKAKLAKEGKYNGGNIPFGYKIDRENDNKIIIDDEEATIVREIFNLYERGLSQPKIAKELSQRGVEGRSVRKTTLFTISLVHQVLTNKFLTGEKHLNKGSSYERQYPQIITEEQFYRCREIARSNNKALPKSSSYIHYGTGIIKCAECGRNFVSSGYKNYYHCRDAYNPYREFETKKRGESAICKNKLCINCNVMDSLLWELGGDYESTFIITQAKEKLQEYEQEKAVLQLKMSAIPAQIAVIDGKIERNSQAYIDGYLSEKKFKENTSSYKREINNLHKQENEYRKRIADIDADIDTIQKSINAVINPRTDEEVGILADTLISIREHIAAITDDKERKKIIQRQIKKVVIEPVTITYKFKKYPNGKEVKAKKISIESRYHSNRVIYYLPNTGKGGIYLTLGSDGEFKQFHPTQYLIRRVDKSRVARNERIKKEKQDAKNKILADLEAKGYYPMEFIMQDTHLCYSTLYNAIQAGKLKAKKVERTWYAKGKDIDKYIETYHPQPKPKKNEMNLSPEEKLLKAALSM